MTTLTRLLTILTGLLAIALQAAPAKAQLARTFVSAASGNDANDCNRLTPCRTFQRAHDQTFDQGEITVLDPGGYGALTIAKSIAIINDGVGEAGLLVSGGVTGIVINAPAQAYVSLRGLTIQGIGFGGGRGIHVNSGFAVTLTNCVIRNLTGTALTFAPAGDARLAVSRTLVADNGFYGIAVIPTGSGAVTVDLDHVDVRNNSQAGILIDGVGRTGSVSAAIVDSVSSANQGGVFAVSDVGKAPTTAVVTRSVIANNTSGLFANAARLVVGESHVSGNGSTWSITGGGALQSFGDNHIAGNGDGDPAPPVIPTK